MRAHSRSVEHMIAYWIVKEESILKMKMLQQARYGASSARTPLVTDLENESYEDFSNSRL